VPLEDELIEPVLPAPAVLPVALPAVLPPAVLPVEPVVPVVDDPEVDEDPPDMDASVRM
jgi:hypothetical protein